MNPLSSLAAESKPANWNSTALGQENGEYVLRFKDGLWTLYRLGYQGRVSNAPSGHYATEETAKQAGADLA